MRHARLLLAQTALAFGFVLSFSLMAAGQQAATVPARITQPVDMENLVTLRGNTHPLARPEYDQGAAPDSLPTERMLLVLQRSAEQEAALRKLLDEQQIKSSANYHMWLTPEQFGQQFGPADADIQAVTGWLTSQGFQVSHVATGRTVIEFSGTAGQVRQAFHTEIHKFVVKGEEHWANASDPQIPAALTPVVAGFASLNNFPRKPMHRLLGTFSKSKATGVVTPLFTYTDTTGTWYAVGPTDFATIYNVSPLWTAGIDGTGQTVAIVSDSNINTQDVVDFRSFFGLPENVPQIILNGPDPGITSDETEADLDVEWAGAVARGATIDLVVSEDTDTTYGIDLSALYIIDNNLAPVMSESYGACEAYLGNSGNTLYSTLWEQGAAQGITLLMAAGDTGSAGCDVFALTGVPAAQYGLEVDGLASTPFNVAVGGTDFNDVNNWSTYWSATNSPTTQSSALSYIPEMTWNDSCANTGNVSGCAAGVASDGSDLVAGSGGQSNCAVSTSTACTEGYGKPSWQTGTGVPSDGVRDIPDVSLFAGDGNNGSFYVVCEADALQAGESSCDVNAASTYFLGGGGTSASAQAFAGIMALVNQKTSQRQGNANYVLYPLAAPTGASCASTLVMAPTASASSCIFYDVQVGNNSVACYAGSYNCGSPTGSVYGILVNPSNTTQPAWLAGGGYDLATGIGTVNAYNLVQNWKSTFVGTGITLNLSPTTITHGQSVTVTGNVTPASATGDVSLVAPAGSSPSNSTGIGPFTLSSGAFSGSTNMLPGGTYGVTAHYAGNGTDGSSNSTPPVQVTVTPESSLTDVQVVTEDCNGNFTYGVTSVPYGYVLSCPPYFYLGYWLRVDVTNSSGNLCYDVSSSNPTGLLTYQCPTGQVTVTDNGQPPPDLGAPSGTPGTYALNSQGHAEDQFIQLTGGTNSLVATYAGNASYNGSKSATDTVTVTQAPTAIAVTASNTTVTSGQSVTLTATVSTTSVGFAPTGAVQFLNSNVPMTGSSCGSPCTVTTAPVNASASGFASLTATLTTSFTATATITANYVADTNYSASTSSPLTVTVNSGTPDFGVVPSPNSIAIASPGASGSTSIGISPLNGFTGTVSLSCAFLSTSPMPGGTCSLAAPSITPTTTTTLTVNTTAPSTVIGLFNSPRWLAPLGGAIFAAFFLLLIPTKRGRLKLAFGSLFLVLLAAALVACGGSSSVSTPPSGGTPTGSYTVVVTGVTGSLSRSANVTVTVE
ncbi:MAG: protease pro-enzyme activation domain-containing protein [Terriglobia bacterium]